MSTTTSNYGLKKPVDADNADLKIFVADNMDIIDAELLKRLVKDATTGKVSKSDLPILDADGINTNPTNSAFRATGAGTQALPASAPTKLTFTVEEFDIQNEYDAVNSRFTAKTAGVYIISTCMRVGNTSSTNTTNPQLFIGLYKNGAEFTRMQNFVAVGIASSAYQAHGCAVIKLNAGDYVESYGYCTIALTVQSNVGATFFSAVKIG